MLCMRNHVANTLLAILLFIQSHGSDIASAEPENIVKQRTEFNESQKLRISRLGKRQADCEEESVTTVNNERIICKNELIFEERFHNLNESIWSREIKIPQEPDYEFCVYRNDEGIAKTHQDYLEITPRILEEAYGDNAVYIGKMVLANCSSNVVEECQREATGFYILQPVISTRLTTKNSFNFRFGKIEINAKFPQGDWLFPELYLLPRYESNDEKYSFAKVILGMARGNDKLYNSHNYSDEYGSKLLEYGYRFGIAEHFQYKNLTKFRRTGPWATDFHKYTTVWKDKGFTFLIDGTKVGFLYLRDSDAFPFEQEFYLSIGLGVGGLRVFGDHLTNDKYAKPWKNSGAKAMLNFWKAKNDWLPTWKRPTGSTTSMKIKSIRIWSV